MTVTSRPSEQKKRSSGSSGRMILRIIWTSVKVLIIPVACIAALIIGLAIGYVVLGDKPLAEVFDSSTWKHMFDLVFAEGN
jgi:hypothetical protein